jgi:hypothetical protein
LDDTDVDEPEMVSDIVSSGTASGSRAWVGRITGMVVAATVAFAIIFGAGVGEEAQPQLADSAVTIDGPARQAPPAVAEISASDLARANAYMLHHVQQQALNQPGVSSFVKLVTYDDQ